MQNKKENRIFEMIDKIIDEGYDGDMPLHTYIRYNNQGLRMRCIRVFGGVKSALEAYGYICNTTLEPLDFNRMYEYVDVCFTVNTDGHVKVDFDTLFRKISELEAIGYDVNTDNVIKEVTEFLVLDRIESFVIYHNECVADILDARPRGYPTNQVEYLIQQNYLDRAHLYRTYSIFRGMMSHSNFTRTRLLMELGVEFENLVCAIFKEATISHERHAIRGNCIPDFISGNTWLDAKLSKSTTLNAGCATITKYRQHTEHLVIIYALDDTSATDDRATFVHVSEYYPYISSDLKRKVDAFIRKAEAVRFGGAA